MFDVEDVVSLFLDFDCERFVVDAFKLEIWMTAVVFASAVPEWVLDFPLVPTRGFDRGTIFILLVIISSRFDYI